MGRLGVTKCPKCGKTFYGGGKGEVKAKAAANALGAHLATKHSPGVVSSPAPPSSRA